MLQEGLQLHWRQKVVQCHNNREICTVSVVSIILSNPLYIIAVNICIWNKDNVIEEWVPHTLKVSSFFDQIPFICAKWILLLFKTKNLQKIYELKNEYLNKNVTAVTMHSKITCFVLAEHSHRAPKGLTIKMWNCQYIGHSTANQVIEMLICWMLVP